MSGRHEVRVATAGSVVRLVLAGEIDVGAAADVVRAGSHVLAGSPERLVVDLSETTFLDSSGIGALVIVSNEAGEGSVPVQIILGPPSVMRVLEISGVIDAFEILPTTSANGSPNQSEGPGRDST